MAIRESGPRREPRDVHGNDPKPEPVDYTQVEGFHVFLDKRFLGTYETEEDAQAYIDGHLGDRSDVRIVEGHAPAEGE